MIAPFCERFGLEGIVQGFGQSEAMLLLSKLETPTRQLKPNALGELSGDMELKLLRDDGEEATTGEVGNLSSGRSPRT